MLFRIYSLLTGSENELRSKRGNCRNTFWNFFAKHIKSGHYKTQVATKFKKITASYNRLPVEDHASPTRKVTYLDKHTHTGETNEISHFFNVT